MPTHEQASELRLAAARADAVIRDTVIDAFGFPRAAPRQPAAVQGAGTIQRNFLVRFHAVK